MSWSLAGAAQKVTTSPVPSACLFLPRNIICGIGRNPSLGEAGPERPQSCEDCSWHQMGEPVEGSEANAASDLRNLALARIP